MLLHMHTLEADWYLFVRLIYWSPYSSADHSGQGLEKGTLQHRENLNIILNM